MRHVRTLAAILLVVLAAGCAIPLQEKQNLAVAAGFKVIAPTKPDQKALLPTLPAGKVMPVKYQGRTYYVLPDAKNNRAYVGGLTEYQTYRRLGAAKRIREDTVTTAQTNRTITDWGAWDGWSTVRRMGNVRRF